jgi:uncharacterized membrane protein
MRNKRKSILVIVGFIMLATGFLALSLSMVGLRLFPLVYIDRLSPLAGFVVKLLLILGGIILMATSRIDWEREIKDTDL